MRIPIFVATRREEVPGICHAYFSVDGSVPGAARTWDHHVTGEPINLAAMPGRIDVAEFDGVGTTLADTDALASVVAVLFGGADHLPPAARDVLMAASWWCDHLGPHPTLGREANRRGRRLDAFVATALASGPRSEFARLCRLVARRIRAGRALPGSGQAGRGHVRQLLRGRLRLAGGIIVADLRGLDAIVPPIEVYRWRAHARGAVFVGDHPRGGIRYTIGRNPLNSGGITDIGPVLAALARREFEYGAPALRPEPGPGTENWGGRREVGGSPWNYGSRLGVEEVVAVMVRGAGLTAGAAS